MRLIVARCSTAIYSGRLETVLPEALRLIMIKADGSVLLHADAGGYQSRSTGAFENRRSQCARTCPDCSYDLYPARLPAGRLKPTKDASVPEGSSRCTPARLGQRCRRYEVAGRRVSRC